MFRRRVSSNTAQKRENEDQKQLPNLAFQLLSAFLLNGKTGRYGGTKKSNRPSHCTFFGKKEYFQTYSSFLVFTEMTGILLNNLPHHTYVPCSLVRYPFHLIPQRNNCFFHTNGKRSRVVLFHLAGNSHRFFHTNGKRLLSLDLAFFFALATGCTFSRAYHRLHIFPRLAPVPYFPALGYIFSRAWRQLHIFPRLAPSGYFPALGTGCMCLLQVPIGLWLLLERLVRGDLGFECAPSFLPHEEKHFVTVKPFLVKFELHVWVFPQVYSPCY